MAAMMTAAAIASFSNPPKKKAFKYLSHNSFILILMWLATIYTLYVLRHG
jgi:hypothetical protein